MKLIGKAKAGVARVAGTIAFLGLLALAFLLTWPAAAQVDLPDTGVDVAGLVTAAITLLGGIVVVIVGGYFAFLAVKAALVWGRRAFG